MPKKCPGCGAFVSGQQCDYCGAVVTPPQSQQTARGSRIPYAPQLPQLPQLPQTPQFKMFKRFFVVVLILAITFIAITVAVFFFFFTSMNTVRDHMLPGYPEILDDYGTSETDSHDHNGPSSETVSQKNAVSKAQSFLNVSAFSRDGLISQLEFMSFSYEDAVYGADNCGANWNEQAARKAASYLNMTAFSRDDLIRQLIFDRFTYEQAVYGVDMAGV